MWRPGDDGPDRDAEFATIIHPNKYRQLPLSRQRQLLPIFNCRTSLLYAIETYRTVVVVGETGCGKTTQLPQYLHEAGWTAGGRVVVCTQPRRVAAVTVAQRVAEELGCDVGTTVGYAVRFDDRSGPDTAIKFCTDGLLVREALRDPLLSRVSVVIVDEAHERSLHTDVLLGLLKKVQRRRKDLRVIVASATLDAEKFREFFETMGSASKKSAKRPKESTKEEKGSSSADGSTEEKAPNSHQASRSSTAQERALAAVDAAMAAAKTANEKKLQGKQSRTSRLVEDSEKGCGQGGGGRDTKTASAADNVGDKNDSIDDGDGDDDKPSATIVSVSGRTHPVEILFADEPLSDYIRGAVDTVLEIQRREGEGDVLVFLPGMEEVDSAVRLLRESDNGDLLVLPLYAALPARDQMRVFERPRKGVRKVICATTIAETSITIDGIRFVVDAGFHRLPYFNPTTGIESLLTAPVSRASAVQRAGRAGRTMPGKCFRLYTEKDFMDDDVMPATTPPEMQRVSLTWAVLQLKALGIDDVLHFDFVSPPTAETMIHALEMLYSLGALDDDCRLTSPLGERLAEFPLEPRLGRALLASWDLGCGEEMTIIAAMLSVGDVWTHPRGSRLLKDKLEAAMSEFAVNEGDHITLLNVFRSFEDEPGENQQSPQEWCAENMLNYRALVRAREIHRQLVGYMRRFAPSPGAALASCGDDTTTLLKCVVTGFFANVARLGPDGLFHTIRGSHRVQLHPTSVLAKFGAPPEFVVFDQYVSLSQDFIRNCSRVSARWLLEIAPHFYETRDSRGRSWGHKQSGGDAGIRTDAARRAEEVQGRETAGSGVRETAADRIFQREAEGTSLMSTALLRASHLSSSTGTDTDRVVDEVGRKRKSRTSAVAGPGFGPSTGKGARSKHRGAGRRGVL